MSERFRNTIAVIGALLIFASYPLFLITDLSPIHYLFTCAGTGIVLVALSTDTLKGRIILIVGLVQLGYFCIFLYNLMAIKYGWKFLYEFIIFMALCILILLFRLLLRMICG